MLMIDGSVPETLYRGITVPGSLFSVNLLKENLTPGAEPLIDAYGRKVDSSGNEYGVYMSDNSSMVEDAYSKAKYGQTLPDSPSFNWKGTSPIQLWTPDVGIGYTINSKGTDAHIPFMSSSMRGVYNNGYVGNEWVASIVPNDSYRVTNLSLGSDVLHGRTDFRLDAYTLEEAAEALKMEYERRLGRLALASELISSMPEPRRFIMGAVDEELLKIRIATSESNYKG